MNIGGVDFYEDANNKTPVYSWATENQRVQRKLYVRGDPLSGAELTNAALVLLGCATIETDLVAGVTRRWVHRQTPAAFPAEATPDNPFAFPTLFCTSIPTAEPASRPAGVDAEGRTNYEWYRYHTVWESLPYEVAEDDLVTAVAGPLRAHDGGVARPDEGDRLRLNWDETRYVTKQVDPGSRTLSLKQGLPRFINDEGKNSAPVNEGMPVTQARLVVRYTHHALPFPGGVPFAAIQKALNTVNDEDFDGFQLGTLLLTDARYRLYRSAFGQRICDVTFHKIYLPNFDRKTSEFRGWQSLFRVVNGEFRYWYISADGGFATPFDTPPTKAIFGFSSFPELFRPTQG